MRYKDAFLNEDKQGREYISSVLVYPDGRRAHREVLSIVQKGEREIAYLEAKRCADEEGLVFIYSV